MFVFAVASAHFLYFQHDTQLVSILYRNHKSLPTAAAKISSLYIFDALARAARHHSTKHGLSGDAFTHPGNSASFLFKMGGVVEGLFQDMMTIRSSESKVSHVNSTGPRNFYPSHSINFTDRNTIVENYRESGSSSTSRHLHIFFSFDHQYTCYQRTPLVILTTCKHF